MTTELSKKLNSLSAAAVRTCSPGVVDVYQETESWSYTLVDPDNRQPIVSLKIVNWNREPEGITIPLADLFNNTCAVILTPMEIS